MRLTPSERTRQWRLDNPEKARDLYKRMVKRQRKMHPEDIKRMRDNWRANNKEKCAVYRINYSNTHINTRIRKLNTKKYGYVAVNKRAKPINMGCEVCHKPANRLDYHHWNDDYPCLGLWLCVQCHIMAEKVDKGLHIIYLREKHGMVLQTSVPSLP